MKITLKKPWVVDMCELMKLDDTSPNVEKKKEHNELKGGVRLIDHTTSLLCVIATNVRGICLSKVNEVMHPSMVFHCINDQLGNSMH
jgi:hypothetical protein